MHLHSSKDSHYQWRPMPRFSSLHQSCVLFCTSVLASLAPDLSQEPFTPFAWEILCINHSSQLHWGLANLFPVLVSVLPISVTGVPNQHYVVPFTQTCRGTSRKQRHKVERRSKVAASTVKVHIPLYKGMCKMFILYMCVHSGTNQGRPSPDILDQDTMPHTHPSCSRTHMTSGTSLTPTAPITGAVLKMTGTYPGKATHTVGFKWQKIPFPLSPLCILTLSFKRFSLRKQSCSIMSQNTRKSLYPFSLRAVCISPEPEFFIFSQVMFHNHGCPSGVCPRPSSLLLYYFIW